MTGAATNGFDMLVQLSEAAISTGLGMLPAGATFPLVVRKQVNLPIQYVDLTGTHNIQVPYDTWLELERPSVQFDSVNNLVKIHCDLGPSSELTAPPVVAALALISQVPLSGGVDFTCPVGTAAAVSPWPGNPLTGRAAVANLMDAATTTAIPVQAVNLGTVIANTSNIVLGAAALQVALEGAFTDLPTRIGTLPLTSPVPIGAGPTPVRRLSDLQTRILPPSPGNPRPALGLGAMSEASAAAGLVGNLSATTQVSNLTGGVVRIANAWLIELVAETIEQSPGFAGVHFNINTAAPSASLAMSVVVHPPGGDAFTLNHMNLTIAAGAVHIAGDGSMSGFCWSADFNFSLDLSFTCNPVTGALTATTSPPVVNGTAHIPWYCWIVVAAILGIIVGALAGWIVGVIVGIITAIILATIDVGMPGLPINTIPGLFNAFGGVPLPLPIGSPGLLIDTCAFDDLGIRGHLQFVDLSPRQAQGLDYLAVGQGFDLDSGQVWPLNPISLGSVEIDLAWNGAKLAAANGCQLAAVAGSMDQLTLTALEHLAYTQASFPGAAIPSYQPLPWPFQDLPPLLFAGPPLVFAARTNQGRYAKCAAWRRSTDGALFLWFETYASPTVALSLVATCTTTKRKIVARGEEPCLVSSIEPTATMNLRDRFLDLRQPTGRMFMSGAIGSLAGGGLPQPVPPRHHCAGDRIVHEEGTAFWVRVNRAQHVEVRALPTLFVVPVSFKWTVLGTTLPQGAGHAAISGVNVVYDDTSPYLELSSPLGVPIIGQISVLATDAAGRMCEAAIGLNRPGTVKLGGCQHCAPTRTLDEFVRGAAQHPQIDARASIAAARLQTGPIPVARPPAPSATSSKSGMGVRRTGRRRPARSAQGPAEKRSRRAGATARH